MGNGFRSALRLAATVVAAAAVARAAESARRLIDELSALDPPRRPAIARSPAPGVVPPPEPLAMRPMAPALGLTSSHLDITAPPAYHPFGPTPSPVPARGIGFRATQQPLRSTRPSPAHAPADDELEASGELDDTPVPSPIDLLLARRHAADRQPAYASARDAPTPEPPRPSGRHRRDADAVDDEDQEIGITLPLERWSALTLRIERRSQDTLTVTISLPGATVAEPL